MLGDASAAFGALYCCPNSSIRREAGIHGRGVVPVSRPNRCPVAMDLGVRRDDELGDCRALWDNGVAVALFFVIPAEAKPLRSPSRHAGLVPASTVPRGAKALILRDVGPRNTSGVTER